MYFTYRDTPSKNDAFPENIKKFNERKLTFNEENFDTLQRILDNTNVSDLYHPITNQVYRTDNIDESPTCRSM